MSIFKKIFGTYSSREIKRNEKILDAILALEDKYKAMDEQELKSTTQRLKKRLADSETLDDILPDAFAACREAADRVLNMRHFPVQLIGGIILHQGRIAEMKTGEGKTLVATLPAYLNALAGEGVHIVTVNDYLAKRDSEWMGKIYRYLGLSVGLIVHGLDSNQRREAYAADITYGTNNEFGFDYLRDNMVIYKEQMVQRGHNFAIVDEVDSILIDEARTPLIISGQGDKSTDLYFKANKFASKLTVTRVKELDDKSDSDEIKGDYIVDEKARTATITQEGIKKAESFFNVENITEPENISLMHHINQALKAHGVMKRDVDYVVKDGQVIIVDEFTGRLMFGRRFSDGLHQAIEAKEGVKIERESRTLATITFQNYFRMYKKLAGMTGTALTEAEEFREIYKLDVIEIPTNKPMIRVDHDDLVYKTERGKFNAVIDQIVECYRKGQPVLVGTISIEKSEHLSRLLSARSIPHKVLNAKHHEKEAEIVAQAGKKSSVTIATNMAGRGTDIVLGGNAEFLAKEEMRKQGIDQELIEIANSYEDTTDEAVLEARKTYSQLYNKYREQIQREAEEVKQVGGLFILGTERHESRRIDNQLRGRAGRQGDPGESRFYLSLEDDLMRLFGGERMLSLMNTLNIDENTPIENSILTNTIEGAQKKVESRNFAIRKNVLQFDDVMNQQREIIYSQRKKVLNGENIKDNIKQMINDSIERIVDSYLVGDSPDNWNLEGLREYYSGYLLNHDDLRFTVAEMNSLERDYVKDFIKDKAFSLYEQREKEYGSEIMREIERVILLKTVDTKWMNHLDDMEELRNGIYLRAYAQRDPVIEYRVEGFNMFEEMIESIKEETSKLVLTVKVRSDDQPQREQVAKPIEPQGDPSDRKPIVKKSKVGRNDPCPCGSGKKYKKCCGFDEQ